MSAPSPVPPPPERSLLLAPSLDGRDGVSRVGRLLDGALAAAFGAEGHRAWTLDGDGAGRGRSGSGGSRLRFALRAAGAGLGPGRGLLVLASHLHLLPAALPLRARGARLAVYLHGIECWEPQRGLRARSLAACDLLVANSRHTLGRFREAHPRLAARPALVCAPGIPSAPDPGSPRIGGDPYALVVGRMSRAERYKGHDLLLDLWPRVRAAHPGFGLVVAGEGDDRGRLEAKAAASGGGIRFTGSVADGDLEALYAGASFLVLPSSREGFGLVFLEAMRAGRACIAGRGAPEEVVVDGETGLVVDPGDGEAVLRAVLALAGDRERCAAMGAAGRRRFEEGFTAGAFRGRFAEVLGALGFPGGRGADAR